MKRHLVVAAGALGFAFITSGAHAQFVDPVCGFQHPQKAKQIKASLVQAYVSCANPGGNPINDTTENGIPSCSPPETISDHNGGGPDPGPPPTDAWHWDFLKGQGSVTFKAAKNKLGPPPAANSVGDAADVAVTLKLKGVIDNAGPVNGDGTLATTTRATLRDRNGTPGQNADDVPMTVVDFPVGFGFSVIAGQAKLKTTANAVLQGGSNPTSLPKCASLELVDAGVNDEQGNRFLSIGTFLPSK